ncbi:MAG: helix-turn-helix domain-containing protein [Sulfolobales archaeon]
MTRSKMINARIRVLNTDCPLLITLKEFKIRALFHNVVSSGGSSTHFLRVEDGEKILRVLRSRGLRVRSMNREKDLLWVSNPKSCSFCKAVSDLGGFITDLGVDPDLNPIYRILMPGSFALSKLLSRLKRDSIELELIESNRVNPAPELTLRQLQALTMAYTYGFFDFPRKVKLKDLSIMLGIKPSTTDEILRSALKKVVREYLRRIYGEL